MGTGVNQDGGVTLGESDAIDDGVCAPYDFSEEF